MLERERARSVCELHCVEAARDARKINKQSAKEGRFQNGEQRNSSARLNTRAAAL